ncbi:MAG: hypothetical protein ACI8ZW_001355, partial [Yoonia sp.]
MSEEPKNPFLDGSDVVPTDEAEAAAKALAEEARAARPKIQAEMPKAPARPARPAPAAAMPAAPARPAPRAPMPAPAKPA